jgi:hypothetical protein
LLTVEVDVLGERHLHHEKKLILSMRFPPPASGFGDLAASGEAFSTVTIATSARNPLNRE